MISILVLILCDLTRSTKFNTARVAAADPANSSTIDISLIQLGTASESSNFDFFERGITEPAPS
jgi:hypothetical protein